MQRPSCTLTDSWLLLQGPWGDTEAQLQPTPLPHTTSTIPLAHSPPTPHRKPWVTELWPGLEGELELHRLWGCCED